MADGNRTEILTELTLEGVQQMQGDLRTIAERFKEGDKARETAQKGFGDWIGTAHQLAGVLGVNLTTVYEKVKGLGAEFIHAGSMAESGDQAVAALIATAQGSGIENAISSAQDLGDRLDDIAVKAGVSGEALGGAFQIILERTGASAKGISAASSEIEKLAVVSAKLGKDVAGISGEYSFMAEGVLKTKGQLFQLLQTTGIFGKDTKKAAEGWAALTDAKRAELLSYGLDKLSGQMAKMPPTFAQAEAGFENMIRIGKEKVGEPIIRELTPALADVAEEMKKLGPDIEEIGKALAKEVGGGIREGGRMMREALGWVKEHKGEIADEIKTAAKTLKSVVEFIIANKEVLGVALGAKTAMPILKPAAGAIGGVASAGANGGLAAFGSGLTGAAGAAASLGILAAAIAALGAIAYAEATLISGLKEQWDDHNESLRKLSEMADRGDENTANAAKTMADLDEAAGRMTPALRGFYNELSHTAAGVRALQAKVAKDDNEMLRKQIALGSKNALQGTGMSDYDEQAKTEQGARNQEAILLNAYNQAMQSGNTQMATLAAQTIAQGDLVGKAFLTANDQVEGGLNAMADLLLASGGQFAGFAASLKGKAAAPPGPKILMPGAKITVNQDFRNKDPDAVAVAFKRDIAKAAERRTSARYTGLFGL